MTQACCSHSAHEPRVTHSTRVVGKRSGRRSYCGKTLPSLPGHRSGPSPTTRCAYAWPRPGGSCRCTKVGALLFYPSTCARAVRAAPAATLSRAEEGTQRHKTSKTTRQRRKEQEGEVDSPSETLVRAASAVPARALPGQLAQRQQSVPPLSPRFPKHHRPGWN